MKQVVYQTLAPSFYTMSLLRFVACGLLLLIPTTLMGAAVPIAVKVCTAEVARVGRSVGTLVCGEHGRGNRRVVHDRVSTDPVAGDAMLSYRLHSRRYAVMQI